MKGLDAMKKIARILASVALLQILTVPYYASMPLPTEEPTELTEEAIIVTEQTDFGERNPDTEMGESTVPAGLQEADKEVLRRFYEEHPEERDDSTNKVAKPTLSPQTRAGWIITMAGSGYGFHYYAQEKYYTCLAACVRMCLKGVAGISVSEASVVNGMNLTPTNNCTMDVGVNYLNSKQGKYYYNDWYSLWSSGFHDLQFEAILSGAPTMIGIAPSSTSYWPYTSSGHCVACYAMMSDKSAYMIADPWGGYEGRDDWKWYSRTKTQVWQAYSSSLGHAA